MARKLNAVELEKMAFARASQIAIDEGWFDGDMWQLEPSDFAPLTAEIARGVIRTQAVKRGKKIATKIKNGNLYIQVIPDTTLVVEVDSDEVKEK